MREFDLVRFGSIWFGSVRLGSVRFGSVRFGSARFGSVRFGSVRFGSVRFGSVRVGSVRFGSDRIGSDRIGFVPSSSVRFDAGTRTGSCGRCCNRRFVTTFFRFEVPKMLPLFSSGTGGKIWVLHGS